MNIPQGFVLVPVEPTGNQLFAGHKANGVYQIYCDMVSAAPPVELPAYDEAKELAACRAHWEKNPEVPFADFWAGWKAKGEAQVEAQPAAWMIQWGSVIPGFKGHREVVLKDPGAIDAAIAPLFTHSDAGEVEHWRNRSSHWKNRVSEMGNEIDDLRAKLSGVTDERDASLAREAETCRSYDSLVDRSNRRGEANESREAALREELARLKVAAANVIVEGDALQQRLTDAEKLFDAAVTALNEIAKVSRIGEKLFEIATLAIGEMSALKPAEEGEGS